MKKIINFSHKSKKIGLQLNSIKKIEAIIKKNNGKLFIIGGNVRDLIQEKKISSFPDLVTDLNTNKTLDLLDKAKIKYSKEGIKFGSIKILMDNLFFDLTSMRKDIDTDGRWAKIKPTDNLFEDAKRRDFTINSIYCDTKGNIFDPFNGLNDLKNRKVKFIGNPDKRIDEDYLRILRFLRFSLIYSKDFDIKGLNSCTKNIKKLSLLSFERRFQELEKIITLEKIERNKKFTVLMNFVEKSLEKKISFEKFNELSSIEKELSDISFQRRIKFLLRDANKKKSDIVFKKIPREFKERIFEKIRFSNYDSTNIKIILTKKKKEFVTDQLIFDFIDKKIEKSFLIDLLKIVYDLRNKKVPISGDDLKKVGFNEGKLIGKALEELKVWWIRNNYKPNKKECINFCKSILPGSKRG